MFINKKIIKKTWNIINNRKIQIYILVSFTMISLLYLINGFWIFWIGYHNIDLGANHFILAELLDRNELNIGDYASDGKSYTHKELYLIGLQQITKGILMASMSSFLFGLSLNEVFNNLLKNARI